MTKEYVKQLEKHIAKLESELGVERLVSDMILGSAKDLFVAKELDIRKKIAPAMVLYGTQDDPGNIHVSTSYTDNDKNWHINPIDIENCFRYLELILRSEGYKVERHDSYCDGMSYSVDTEYRLTVHL